MQELITPAEMVEQWIRDVIGTGVPGGITDQQVRDVLIEIVNAPASPAIKYLLLDVLWQKVAILHSHGFAAPVLEEISNESIYLTYPQWRGRHGTWTSTKRTG